jgi:hypothetical protein
LIKNYPRYLIAFVLISVLLISALTIMPEVDAIKSHGKPNPRSGSETKNIVCGDKLCSDVKSDGKANQQSRSQVGGVLQQSATIDTPDDTVPDAPTSLTATALSSSEIYLSWTAPNNGGSAITDYIIEYKLSADTSYTTFRDHVTGKTGGTVTGLASGLSYDFKVSAINGIGTGPASNVASATPSTATAPDAPTSLSATAISTSDINLIWTAPADDGGSPITGYMIHRNGVMIVDDTASTGTTYSDTGLEPGTTYTYVVMAINAIGASIPSNEATATPSATIDTPDDTVPDAPTSLTATALSSSEINLSWTAPENNGGSPITGYMIYRGDDEVVDCCTGTTYSDDNLDPETEYAYTVMAINAIGASEESNGASATTDAVSVPDAPTSLTATALSSSEINLSWTAPENNGGSPITGYMIYRDGDEVVDCCTGTTYSDDNLDPETEYAYTVMAINAIGASEESNGASATTDAETNSFTLAESGTTKLSKAVTKGTNLFAKGPYSISVEITADIDSVSAGVPKLSNIAGTFTIDGANNLQDVTDHSFTKLHLVISKDLKSIKWTAKEGSGEFKFKTALNFNEPEYQDGKKSTIAKIVLSKATFTPKVTTSNIDFN